MNSQAQLSAAQQLASGGNAGAPIEQSGADAEDDDDIPDLEAAEDDGPVDETGIDPKDIDLVIQQVGCTRAKAVRVLKESGGDLINASEFKYTLVHYNTHLSPCSHGSKRVDYHVHLIQWHYIFSDIHLSLWAGLSVTNYDVFQSLSST